MTAQPLTIEGLRSLAHSAFGRWVKSSETAQMAEALELALDALEFAATDDTGSPDYLLAEAAKKRTP